MFCKNCGATIPDGSAVCPYCSAPQAPVTDAQPQQPQYAQPQQPQYAQPEAPQYGQPQQPQYGDPQYQQYGQPQVPTGPMPNPTVYLILVILGFLCGIIWGALSIGNYSKLKNAVAMGNSEEANKYAKKIRTVIIIGVVLNVMAIIGTIAQNAA